MGMIPGTSMRSWQFGWQCIAHPVTCTQALAGDEAAILAIGEGVRKEQEQIDKEREEKEGRYTLLYIAVIAGASAFIAHKIL